MLDNFIFARFTFIIRFEEQAHLPAYKGGTLRGGFGYALKRAVCVYRSRDCDECMLGSQCAYRNIFDTPLPEGSQVLRKTLYIPHPFIIEPPLDNRTDFEPGEGTSFGLVLIGRIIEFLPFFIMAFDNLGRMGLGRERRKFSLMAVESGDSIIYEGESGTIIGEPSVLRLSDFNNGKDKFLERVELDFLTPVRMIYDEKLMDKPEFHILIRNLLRRLSNLAYFQCGLKLDVDPKEVILSAKDVFIEKDDTYWYDWRRYSSRQKAEMILGGIMGRVSYTGPLEQFIPLLLAGEYIHVGKNTSFGLGKYVIRNDII